MPSAHKRTSFTISWGQASSTVHPDRVLTFGNGQSRTPVPTKENAKPYPYVLGADMKSFLQTGRGAPWCSRSERLLTSLFREEQAPPLPRWVEIRSPLRSTNARKIFYNPVGAHSICAPTGWVGICKRLRLSYDLTSAFSLAKVSSPPSTDTRIRSPRRMLPSNRRVDRGSSTR